jgi:hypothetical protein
MALARLARGFKLRTAAQKLIYRGPSGALIVAVKDPHVLGSAFDLLSIVRMASLSAAVTDL